MKDRKEERAKFASLSGSAKVQYIWDYYKIPIAIIIVAICILISGIVRFANRKDYILYAGVINMDVSDETTSILTDKFIDTLKDHGKRDAVSLDSGFVLSDGKDPSTAQYANASQIKLMAQINAQALDVIVMNDYALKQAEHDEYLMDLSSEDGLNLNDTYSAIVTNKEFLKTSGITEPVYVAIIGNTKNETLAKEYVEYLAEK